MVVLSLLSLNWVIQSRVSWSRYSSCEVFKLEQSLMFLINICIISKNYVNLTCTSLKFNEWNPLIRFDRFHIRFLLNPKENSSLNKSCLSLMWYFGFLLMKWALVSLLSPRIFAKMKIKWFNIGTSSDVSKIKLRLFKYSSFNNSFVQLLEKYVKFINIHEVSY